MSLKWFDFQIKLLSGLFSPILGMTGLPSWQVGKRAAVLAVLAHLGFPFLLSTVSYVSVGQCQHLSISLNVLVQQC